MKLVRLKQSTPEWLAWRKEGITASDVSTLFKANPYKTEWKLWAEKTGRQPEDDIEGNPYVRRGRTFEHLLREHVVAHRNIGLFPACVQHDTNPDLRASLDGIDSQRRPWEFKVPSPGNFEEVRKHGLSSEPAKRYFYQVQFQILVTGAAEGYLIFGSVDDAKKDPSVTEYILLVVPADKDIHEQIIEKSAAFMKSVRDDIEPAKDPDRDLFAPQTAEDAESWQSSSGILLPLLKLKEQLKAEIERVEKEIHEATKPVVEILGENKAGEFAGLRVVRVDRKGTVDWKALLKDRSIDATDETIVGPYRKAGSTNHQLTAL